MSRSKRAGDNARLNAFIARIKGISIGQRQCLMVFKNLYIRHGALVYPSVAMVAEALGVCENTARSHIHALHRMGALSMHSPGGRVGAKRLATVYVFEELKVLELAYNSAEHNARLACKPLQILEGCTPPKFGPYLYDVCRPRKKQPNTPAKKESFPDKQGLQLTGTDDHEVIGNTLLVLAERRGTDDKTLIAEMPEAMQ